MVERQRGLLVLLTLVVERRMLLLERRVLLVASIGVMMRGQRCAITSGYRRTRLSVITFEI